MYLYLPFIAMYIYQARLGLSPDPLIGPVATQNASSRLWAQAKLNGLKLLLVKFMKIPCGQLILQKQKTNINFTNKLVMVKYMAFKN
jgi:hypothetical protein